MTYSLPIRSPRTGGKLGERKKWWVNFTRATREEKFGYGLNFYTDEWLEHRAIVLAKYNAEYYGAHVHFVSEKDATLFLLRWL
jgi:hypothetical protein